MDEIVPTEEERHNMNGNSLTNDDINALGEKVQAFTKDLSPLEQAYMEEVLTRAGAAKPLHDSGFLWKPDPVLALRVSLRSRAGVSQ
jgi:hypothetical protein